MSMENIRDLFLEDETFEDARNKFNTVLQRLFRSMIDTESNEGSITLKMDVSMQTEFIPNHDPGCGGRKSSNQITAVCIQGFFVHHGKGRAER